MTTDILFKIRYKLNEGIQQVYGSAYIGLGAQVYWPKIGFKQDTRDHLEQVDEVYLHAPTSVRIVDGNREQEGRIWAFAIRVLGFGFGIQNREKRLV